jgi:hypothetical protein
LCYTLGMAIVTIALPVTGIRGKLAGIVFSANRSGPFARGLSSPANPGTIGQMNQRGLMAQSGYLWRTLSSAEQADWDTFAETPPETDYNSLGEVVILSGFAWFTRILLRRRRCGLADDLIAPASTPTATPTTFTLDVHPSTGAAADAHFGYTSGEFAAYYAILMLAIAPGLGSNVWTSRYLLCWEAFGLTATSTNFGANYFAAFGTTQVSMRFFGKLYRQSASGIRSVPKVLFSNVT